MATRRIAFSLAVLILASPAIAQASFSGIGFSDPLSGTRTTIVRALSRDGSTVVGESGTDSQDRQLNRACVWTAEHGLETLPDVGSYTPRSLYAVSGDGNAAVGLATRVGGSEFFYWQRSSGVTIVNPPPTADRPNNVQMGISNNGAHAIFTYTVAEQAVPFVWSPTEGFSVVSGLEAGYVPAIGRFVSDGATVVSGIATRPASWGRPFILDELGFRRLGPAVDVTSFPVQMNPDGTRVYISLPSLHRWSASGIVKIQDALTTPAFQVYAGIDDAEERLVGLDSVAKIWIRNYGEEDLNLWLSYKNGLAGQLCGWFLNDAIGISADGNVIAGNGVDRCGKRQGWIVRLTPPALPTTNLCPADTNADLLINGADLSIMLSAFGSSGVCGCQQGADLNGDSLVNGADLSILLSSFGTSCIP